MAKMDRRLWAARAGMIGSLLFVFIFTIEGWLRPGYDACSMFVSELSLGPRGSVQISNFIIVGLLFFVFARGVAREFRRGTTSTAGPLLLTVLGFCFFASGPFVMDPVSTPRQAWSGHGTMHQLIGALAFSLMPASCLVFWRRFRADPRWEPLRSWTLAAGIAIIASVVLMKIGLGDPAAPPGPLRGWVGLLQRSALVFYLAWIFTFARQLALRAR